MAASVWWPRLRRAGAGGEQRRGQQTGSQQAEGVERGTGDFHRAEDLVQEALTKAALRWDSLAEGSPDAWIRTVIYRDRVSWWRRHRREVLAPPRDQPVPPAGEAALVLRDALGRLTARQRAVLVLRYVEDLPLAETAEVLGLTVGSVKKHASVALARLRAIAPELEELMEERR